MGAMGYLFKSFPVLFSYDPEKVRKVRLLAQWINNILCVAQVLLVTFICFYCAWHYNSVAYSKEEITTMKKHYVKKRIFEFSLVVSTILFICSLIAVFAVSFLYFRHMKLKNRDMYKTDVYQLPPPANNLINLGLANTLLGQYIGIDDEDVGEYVLLQDISMYVGSITIFMTILDTIISLSLYVAMRDGQLDIPEIKVIKIIHVMRYLGAFIQVIMFGIMCVQSIYMINVDNSIPGYKCPRNLLEISLVLSVCVLGGAIFASAELIYLTN